MTALERRVTMAIDWRIIAVVESIVCGVIKIIRGRIEVVDDFQEPERVTLI
jgi:hypothetical protein